MSDLEARRRFFAEELEAVCAFRTPGLTEAFAAVPRERFLPAGPWDVLSVSDYTPAAVPPARTTPDADPRRVYHNVGIAIDPERRLFNGHPSTVASWIDVLALRPGARVLHVGAGLGYYTGVMAEVVGPSGRVTAIEVDPGLAARARANIAETPWAEVRDGDGSAACGDAFDAILVNAGVTHPLGEWLAALPIDGRLVLPLTVEMAATIGKGLMMLVTRESEERFAARPLGFVAIYSAVGLRDAALNAALADAMRRQPWPPVTRLRRDPHDPSPSCWFHTHACCWSAA